MNTRQLRHFLAVVDLGTLGAAAEAVHLSQAALSRSLRALEDELRVPLFDRQERRLRPTAYAIEYAQRARRMLFEEKEGARAIAHMLTGQIGSLSFGMGSAIAATLLGPMVLQLLADAPGLRAHTLVQSSEILVEALRAERLDFFIGDTRVAEHDPDLLIEPVYPCTFGWFAREGHPLAGRQRLTISEVSAFPIIGVGYADASYGRRMAQLYGWRLPLDDQFAAVTNDLPTVLTLISSSDAVVPSSDVSMVASMRSGTVTRLQVTPDLDLEMTLGIVERAGRTRSPAAERAFGIVRAHFAAVAREVALQRHRTASAGEHRPPPTA